MIKINDILGLLIERLQDIEVAPTQVILHSTNIKKATIQDYIVRGIQKAKIQKSKLDFFHNKRPNW